MGIDRWKKRQAGRWADRQENRQADRWKEKWTDRWVGRQRRAQTDRWEEKDRWAD